MKRVVGTGVAVASVVALVIVAPMPAGSEGAPAHPLIANGSFEAPDLTSATGAAGAVLQRTDESAFHGAHALTVTSSASVGSGLDVATARDTRPGLQLASLAVKGTASSLGQMVQAAITDPSTGATTTSAPVRLTGWWQTVGVSADIVGPRFIVAVTEVAGGGVWEGGDRYVVDKVAATAAAPRVATVSGRQLFVDGEPFTMHGYTYGAAPLGSLGLPSTANNVLSFHTNPQHCVTDANLMRAAGINTLRITFLDVYDAKALQCFDAFAAAGVGLLHLVNGPGGFQGTNLPAYEEGFRVQLTTVIEQVKDHPATLGYVIGNENSRTQPELQEAWFGMLDRLAAEAKALAPTHLTTVSVNSQQFFPNGPWGGVGPDVAPNVDLWGFNHYGNASGYPDTLWPQIIDQDPSRPVWMSEFGTDRFRCAHGPPDHGSVSCQASGSFEDQAPQAAWDVAQWRDIAANLSVSEPGGAMVGGTLFMWSDMWWFSFPVFTGGATTPATHEVSGLGRTNPVTGEPNGFVRSHFPDQHFSPEWIGVGHILRVDQLGPRVTSLAYDAMADEYTGVAGPRVSGAGTVSVGACGATVAWSTDVPTLSRVDYGQVVLEQVGDALTADNTIADTTVEGAQPTTSHEVLLSHLTPATTYRVYVRGFTEAGRPGTAPAIELTTAAAPDATCG